MVIVADHELIHRRVVDASDVLTELHGNLCIGCGTFRMHFQQFKRREIPLLLMAGVQSMCLQHIVLALTKLIEFWERYHDVVPEEFRAEFKALLKELNRRGVREFRNAAAGHIWANELGRPLVQSEVQERLTRIADGDREKFLQWVFGEQVNVYPTTVVSIVEAVRDRLMEVHGIPPAAVIDR
jgi:hypothetical protein